MRLLSNLFRKLAAIPIVCFAAWLVFTLVQEFPLEDQSGNDPFLAIMMLPFILAFLVIMVIAIAVIGTVGLSFLGWLTRAYAVKVPEGSVAIQESLTGHVSDDVITDNKLVITPLSLAHLIQTDEVTYEGTFMFSTLDGQRAEVRLSIPYRVEAQALPAYFAEHKFGWSDDIDLSLRGQLVEAVKKVLEDVGPVFNGSAIVATASQPIFSDALVHRTQESLRETPLEVSDIIVTAISFLRTDGEAPRGEEEAA
jgi:hypothetical protein